MDETALSPAPVRCAICAEIIGRYERGVFETRDGEQFRGSLLSVEPGIELLRAVHAACWDER